jgi:hypothetical protein
LWERSGRCGRPISLSDAHQEDMTVYTRLSDHGRAFVSHPSTMVPTYGAGRGHRGSEFLKLNC